MQNNQTKIVGGQLPTNSSIDNSIVVPINLEHILQFLATYCLHKPLQSTVIHVLVNHLFFRNALQPNTWLWNPIKSHCLWQFSDHTLTTKSRWNSSEICPRFLLLYLQITSGWFPPILLCCCCCPSSTLVEDMFIIPCTNLSSSSGTVMSSVIPVAKSSRKSAGFIAICGVKCNDWKYSIASLACPEYRALPSESSMSLSKMWNIRLDGWCMVVTITLPT